MKRLMTTAAVLAALTLPALAEADNPSTKQGEASGNLKASTSTNTPGSEMDNGMNKPMTPAQSTVGTGMSNQGMSGTMGAPAKPPGDGTSSGNTK